MQALQVQGDFKKSANTYWQHFIYLFLQYCNYILLLLLF